MRFENVFSAGSICCHQVYTAWIQKSDNDVNTETSTTQTPTNRNKNYTCGIYVKSSAMHQQ